MTDFAIQVQGLSKKYRIGNHAPYHRFTELLAKAAVAPFSMMRSRVAKTLANDVSAKPAEKEFWALKDVNFEIKQGEVVGIIGRNGAGKSTLLKLLSRISPPTHGEIRYRGRIGSLLEVGTGFHPELTGRDNIYLNGAILGMTRSEVRRRFDEIVAFAEVEKFLDTSVKHYSSGMYMRLAFAVAAHLEPEILLVDEVLAVGDAEFQKKCLGKMGEVAKGGRTILFVSHNMGAIRSICTHGLLLANGQIVCNDKIQNVIGVYEQRLQSQDNPRTWDDPQEAPGSEVSRIRSVMCINENEEPVLEISTSSRFGIRMVYDVLQDGHILVPNYHFYTNNGQCLFVSIDANSASQTQVRSKGQLTSTVWIPPDLLSPQRISVNVALTTFTPWQVHFHEQDVLQVDLIEPANSHSLRAGYNGELPGVIRPRLQWDTTYNG